MSWIAQFEHATFQSFDFLIPLGYRAHSKQRDIGISVHFVSFNSKVIISACPIRLEFDVEISMGNSRRVGLGELQLIFPNENLPPFQYGIYEAHLDEQKLRSIIAVTAERFQIVAIPLLTGKLDWDDIKRWKHDLEQRKRISDISDQLAVAFKEKRWADVVKAFHDLGDKASALDTQRTAYAVNQLQSK